MDFNQDFYDYYFLFIQRDVHEFINKWINNFSELFYLVTMILINKKISMFIILFLKRSMMIFSFKSNKNDQ